MKCGISMNLDQYYHMKIKFGSILVEIRRAAGTWHVRSSALVLCSRVLVLRTTGLRYVVQLEHLEVSLGRGPGGQTTFHQRVEYDFEALQK